MPACSAPNLKLYERPAAHVVNVLSFSLGGSAIGMRKASPSSAQMAAV